MRWGLAFALLAVLPACSTISSTAPPSYAKAEYGAAPAHPAAPPAPHRRVLVTIDKTIGHACEIMVVFDIHTHADSQDKGFEELRAKAEALGADAVIGAEFEHGDGNEPSHLSGMAVRYIEAPPDYEPIGQIDIPSDEDATDKGLDTMRARAAALGADEVVNVQFEHGEEGKLGHLTGLAVRFRR